MDILSGELLSALQAAPAALQVLYDSDDLRHDAELLLLLPPRECLLMTSRGLLRSGPRI